MGPREIFLIVYPSFSFWPEKYLHWVHQEIQYMPCPVTSHNIIYLFVYLCLSLCVCVVVCGLLDTTLLHKPDMGLVEALYPV